MTKCFSGRGVQYYTGQVFNIKDITEKSHNEVGCASHIIITEKAHEESGCASHIEIDGR